ncbi:hypothetical protein FRC02_001859 [Tulasnella sp. 418]|nr:hypothetical protein FRC02_001859 [Tulasnella sp. 418]
MRDQLGSSEEMALAALKLLMQNMKAPQSTSDDDCRIEDNHDIQQLDAEVSAITKAVEIIRETAKNWTARCRRHRNQVASLILQVPEEIISTIFLHLFQSTPSENKYRKLRNVRLVCSDFYKISESTPRLWSYISNTWSTSESLFRYIWLLDKSRGAPLDIDLFVDSGDVQENDLELLDVVFKHSHRWQSFRCEYKGFSSQRKDKLDVSLARFANIQAPQLRELTVEVRGTSITPKQWNLLRNGAPSIRHLEIGHIPISRDSPLLSGLSFLRITPWQGTRPPTSEQYIQVLTSCLQLEELYLIGLHHQSPLEGEGSHTLFHTEIQLQKLNILGLKYLHPVTIRSLLSSIKANPTELLVVFTHDALGREEEVIQMAFSSPSCRSFLSKFTTSPERLRLTKYDLNDLLDQSCSICAEPKSKEGAPLRFHCGIASVQSLGHIYRELFPTPVRRTIQALEFDVHEDDFLDGSLTACQLFEGLVGLEELRLPNVETDPWLLLAPLSKPVSNSTANQSEVWLCPRLRKLEFENIGFKIDDLWKFLKRRYTSAGSLSRELQINVVNNVKYSRQSDVPLSIADKVVKLIGRENFTWHGYRRSPSKEWEEISQ